MSVSVRPPEAEPASRRCAASLIEPMAASTCDGCTLPEEQAEPEDTRYPAEIEGNHGGFGPEARHA